MNPYRFENQNREIVLSRYNMPTPWMNYLSNGTLHAMISQAGGGVAWYRSPQIWRINHYRFFHLPTDRSGFYTYIKDGDSVWCPTSEPCACKPEKWEAAHGMGYTRFTAERDGLRTEVTYLVSPLKNVMLWHLELCSDCDRNVTIYPYVELGMMEFMRELQWQCYNKHQLSVYEKDGVLIYRYGVENQPKPDETPLVYFASDVPAAGFDCDRDAFIGSYRSEEAPIGLEHEHLKNSTLFGGDPCFALELPLTLRAGETKSLNIYLGTEMTESEISKSLAACKAPDFFAASMQKLAETWEDFFSGFQCSLPDKDAETMINIWNPYQMERNFRFSRNISYYATGTFRGIGVRDTAQDVLAMIPLQLDRAKEKFELLLTQQYQDGHCNHYFFPTEGWEPVTRVHSDNHLWLVMDAYHIALEEGNVSYLDTQAPYFDGGSGTIWEHIRKSIRFTTQNMGAHGFPLMLSSDWNDMLYKVCRKGKGESIWTGMQFAVALRMMQELAERMGEPEFAEECKALYARQQALCPHACVGWRVVPPLHHGRGPLYRLGVRAAGKDLAQHAELGSPQRPRHTGAAETGHGQRERILGYRSRHQENSSGHDDGLPDKGRKPDLLQQGLRRKRQRVLPREYMGDYRRMYAETPGKRLEILSPASADDRAENGRRGAL